MNEKIKVNALDARTWHIVDGEVSSAYVYLLEGDERAVYIDTGFSNFDAVQLARTLTQKPLFAINTHGHLDHIAANHQFDEVYLHPADEGVFAQHSDPVVRMDYLKGLLTEFGKPHELLEQEPYRKEVQRLCDLPRINNRKPVVESDCFDLGGRTLRIVETPGHTRGSICVLDVERRWLFTGDTVCDMGALLHFDHSAGVDAFLASIRKLQAMQQEYDVMWPGHHRLPIEKELLNKYEACALRILSGEQGMHVNSAAGSAQILIHDGISLSFPC